jgi:predicted glycosyltransferase involved in capsule biosynthesis
MNSTCLGSLDSNAIKQYINLWKKEENQERRGSNTDLTQVTYKRHHKERRESNIDLTQVTYKRHHKGRGGQTLT